MRTTDIRLAEAVEELRRRRRAPVSIYRIQLNRERTFHQVAEIVPYLKELGVSHLYLSPYLQAAEGSSHGYDICDHSSVNRELGGREGLAALVRTLREHGMGHIVDIVPNHMGIATAANRWWYDVLENGPASLYSDFFDIDWGFSIKEDLRGKVLFPILGVGYGEALESGALRFQHDEQGFTLQYYSHRLPIAPCTWDRVLAHDSAELAALSQTETEGGAELHSILTAIRNLPRQDETDPDRKAERAREKEIVRRRLARLLDESPPVRGYVDRMIASFNGTPGDPRSFDALNSLLDVQPYRLSHYRVASDEINYRRFFDVNELAALNMERNEVFEASHALLLELCAEGLIDGGRIDHSDGLYDPVRYLERLQQRYLEGVCRAVVAREGAALDHAAIAAEAEAVRTRLQRDEPALARRPWPLWIEKILAPDEAVSSDWPIDGTTGYDFLALVNGLFIDEASEAPLSRLYARWGGDSGPLQLLAYQKKRLVLDASMSSELQMLALQLDRLSERDRNTRDFTLNSLREALREVIASFPVYRSYVSRTDGPSEQDRLWINIAVARARKRNPTVSSEVFEFVKRLLLVELPVSAPENLDEEVRHFVCKFQQVTSPVMAKGVEDTLFYTYNRLLSLNEVGATPERYGTSVDLFHRRMKERAVDQPWSFSALSTHDTKRGEDSRARLNVLSEIPAEWRHALSVWDGMNGRYRMEGEGGAVPDRNTEYLLYQALIGFWPCEVHTELAPSDIERFQSYMQKAIHEAKLHTSWIAPDAAYDEGVRLFVERILGAENHAFIESMNDFVGRLQPFAYLGSLAQTAIKLTAPGIPDTYQGSELWNLSLVDPDNRRPVDFAARQKMLQAAADGAARDRSALLRQLLASPETGAIKLFVVRELLALRASLPGLFSSGEYLPLEVTGEHADHVVAYARRQEGAEVITIVPRLIARLHSRARTGLTRGTGRSATLAEVMAVDWNNTAVLVPQRAGSDPVRRNVLTGAELPAARTDAAGEERIELRVALEAFPIAVLSAR